MRLPQHRAPGRTLHANGKQDKLLLVQITIGSVTILATMAVMVAFINAAMRLVHNVEGRFVGRDLGRHEFFVVVSSAVFLVLAANTVCLWIWALLFRAIGIFTTLEESVYFAIVSFTTVGYGDVVVDKSWRILSGFVAVNGLLAFGIFTAFLIEVIREVVRRR